MQGVGYRYFVCRAAALCGVRGYVKNLADGSVEAYAVGDASALAAFAGMLRQGPAHGLVREVAELPAVVAEELTGFEVRF